MIIMRQGKDNEFKSRVYTERPDYADLPAPEKFQAILGIIGTRLRQHPKAICSYSGGSDSDILIDIIERARNLFDMPPVKYVFFNTGLEMKATKDHVKEVAEKYGVEIEECKPKKNIVLATREYGQPFVSKIISRQIEVIQKNNIPLEIRTEYDKAENKSEKFLELKSRYPKAATGILSICGCDSQGRKNSNSQFSIAQTPYLYEYIKEHSPTFKISKKCCDVCKKQVAHIVEKGMDMVITGEREAEGGERAHVRPKNAETMCFYQQSGGQYRFRPLYYVSDADKAWYKEHYGIRYSDAYEVYGLKRTGCCGCPISSRAVADLELIRPYEPNVVKAAWAIFGDSYRYRQGYNEFKARKREEERLAKEGQISFEELMK
jgi:3'-phosphoadenosine 5'-phosphosulfate sulfotransferase (PAPS reductase)/FAD synthetase